MEKDKVKEYAGRVLLYIVPVLCSICCAKGVGGMLSNGVLSFFAAGIYDTFLRIRENYFLEKIKSGKLFWTAYIVSFLILGLQGVVPTGVLWLMLIVVAALDADLEFAIANYVYMLIQYAIIVLSGDKNVYRFLLYVLLGLVIALLFSQLQERKALPYLAVILVAGDLTLQFAVCQFDLSKMKTNLLGIGIEILSILVFILIAYCYLWRLANREHDMNLRLLILLEPDGELLMQLEEYSMPLLSHSMRISQLSEGAARAIGANEVLAKAGGLYHEIGRITDEQNYIEAGIALGKKANFPKPLLAVIRQHSTGYETPKSAEAAIVMLSDCIVSTGEYLAKAGKQQKISSDKLVASVFQNRLKKGNLADAGLSDEQITVLQDYFMKHTFVGE